MACKAIILVVLYFSTTNEMSTTKEELLAKIKYLRNRIAEDTRNIKPVRDKISLVDDNFDYVDLSKSKITPIMDYDDRKLDDAFRLKKLQTQATTTESGWKANIRQGRDHDDGEDYMEHRETKVTKNFAEQPADIFYRRQQQVKKGWGEEDIKNKPLQWIHCQDVITPYLTGTKKEVREVKKREAHDRSVMRFIQLLSMNTTNYGADDIYAILYQISNLQIRLFQWELSAVKLLFHILAPTAAKHTFLSIKYGVQNLFKTWHLDFSDNVTTLAKQAKIFRPYCLDPNKQDSTLSSKFTPFTPPSKKTTSGDCDESSEEEARRHNVHKHGFKSKTSNKTSSNSKLLGNNTLHDNTQADTNKTNVRHKDNTTELNETEDNKKPKVYYDVKKKEYHRKKELEATNHNNHRHIIKKKKWDAKHNETVHKHHLHIMNETEVNGSVEFRTKDSHNKTHDLKTDNKTEVAIHKLTANTTDVKRTEVDMNNTEKNVDKTVGIKDTDKEKQTKIEEKYTREEKVKDKNDGHEKEVNKTIETVQDKVKISVNNTEDKPKPVKIEVEHAQNTVEKHSIKELNNTEQVSSTVH